MSTVRLTPKDRMLLAQAHIRWETEDPEIEAAKERERELLQYWYEDVLRAERWYTAWKWTFGALMLAVSALLWWFLLPGFVRYWL